MGGVEGERVPGSQWDVGVVYGGSGDGSEGVEEVGLLQYNRGMVRRCLRTFDTDAQARCRARRAAGAGARGGGGGGGSDLVPPQGCRAEAWLRNVHCAAGLQEMSAEEEAAAAAGWRADGGGASGREVWGRCGGGGVGVWNRVLHVGGSGAVYFRRHVFDSAAFREFLRGSRWRCRSFVVMRVVVRGILFRVHALAASGLRVPDVGSICDACCPVWV